MHPRTKDEAATYDLIRSVFEQIEKKEDWCKAATPVANIGVFGVNDGEYASLGFPENKDLEGALQMLHEGHQQFQIIDTEVDFNDYELIIIN